MGTKWRSASAGLVIALGLTGVGVGAYQLLNLTSAPTATPSSAPAASSAPTETATAVPADVMTVTPKPPPPPSGPNPIANSSLEKFSGSPAVPQQWLTNSWGSNKPKYEHVTDDGHESKKSVKITMTDYVDGDAKWYPQPVVLEPGQQYRFSAWYKTDGDAQAVVMFVKADGSTVYFGMPRPLPGADAATTWQAYSETFSVPLDAVSVSPFLFLGSNGFLQVDDVNVQSYTPEGFDRPLVTLTFDDGHEENAITARPAMDKRKLPSTQCFATTFITGNEVAKQAVRDFRDSGHEICSHSVTHPFMTKLSPEDLAIEARDSQEYLQKLTGDPISNFATPYGDYNAGVVNELKQHYGSHRTVDEGFNSKDNFDLYRIRVQNMTPTTTLEQFQSWLDEAKATKTWLVLVYHRITEPGMREAGPYDTPLANFEPQMDALVASGIPVKTWQAALEELVPQVQ